MECVKKPAGAGWLSSWALEEDVDSESAEESGRPRQGTLSFAVSVEEVGSSLGRREICLFTGAETAKVSAVLQERLMALLIRAFTRSRGSPAVVGARLERAVVV